MTEYDYQWQIGKSRREMVQDLRSRPCAKCGAKPGERCRTPAGNWASDEHQARWRTVAVPGQDDTIAGYCDPEAAQWIWATGSAHRPPGTLTSPETREGRDEANG